MEDLKEQALGWISRNDSQMNIVELAHQGSCHLSCKQESWAARQGSLPLLQQPVQDSTALLAKWCGCWVSTVHLWSLRSTVCLTVLLLPSRAVLAVSMGTLAVWSSAVLCCAIRGWDIFDEQAYSSRPSQVVSLLAGKSEMGQGESQMNLGLFVLR